MDYETKLLVNSVDLSEYLVGEYNFVDSVNVPSGFFFIDDDSGSSFEYGQEVDFYLKVAGGSFVKKFSGFISFARHDSIRFRTEIRVDGWKRKAFKTDFSGVFRSDLGNSEMKTIVTNIIQEKFSDWTYDDSSIPDTSITFLRKSYQDRKINAIYDEFSKRVKRVWYVDNNKKYYFISASEFPSVTTVLNDDNLWGNVIKDIDDTNFGNIVRVLGSRFQVNDKQEFDGTGTRDEFVLENFPSVISSVEYSSGTKISTSLEGVEDYSTGSVYDAFYKPDIPSLKFNNNTVAGSKNIIVNYSWYSRIRAEDVDPSSVNFYDIEKVKTIDNANITTQEEAEEVLKNEIENNNFIIDVYTCTVNIDSEQALEDLQIGRKIRLVKDDIDDFFDILETRIVYSAVAGLRFSVRLNSLFYGSTQKVLDFIEKVNQRSEEQNIGGEGIVKTIYWGSNFYVSLDSLYIDSLDADDGTFVLQDSFLTPAPDNRSKMCDTLDLCEDLSDWGFTLGTGSLNSSNFLTGSSSISLIKNSTGTLFVAERTFLSDQDWTGTRFISGVLKCVDSSTLAKISSARVDLVDSSSNVLTGSNIILTGTNWNVVGINTLTATGSIDESAGRKIRMNVVFVNTSDTTSDGDLVMDNFIDNDEVFDFDDYPGILRDDFTGTWENIYTWER